MCEIRLRLIKFFEKTLQFYKLGDKIRLSFTKSVLFSFNLFSLNFN